MPRFQAEGKAEGVILIGSVIAAGCGLWLGAHIRLGPTPAPEYAMTAGDLVAWAAPSAQAAEPEFDSSPTLLVKAGGQWITPEEREAAIADRQAQADVAAQVATDQATVDQVIADAESSAARPEATAERGPPAPAIPPPILISALTP